MAAEGKARDASLREQGFLIEKLRHQLALLARQRFGAKSEGLGQLDLLIEALEQEIGAADGRASGAILEGEDAGSADIAGGKVRPKREPLPDHLPREVVVHAPDEGRAGRGEFTHPPRQGRARTLEVRPRTLRCAPSRVA